MVVAATPIITIYAARDVFLIRLLVLIDVSTISVVCTICIIEAVGWTASAQMLITLLPAAMATFVSLFIETMVHATSTTSVGLLLVLHVVVLMLTLPTTSTNFALLLI